MIRLNLLIFILFSVNLNAQNLVNNPGFEISGGCMVALYSIGPYGLANPIVPPWSSSGYYIPYFNTCANTSPNPDLVRWCSVPDNAWGSKEPRSGDGYPGLFLQIGTSGRTYLQSKLQTPLEAGSWYCASFYVAPAVSTKPWYDLDEVLLTNPYAVDRLGMLFSAERPSEADTSPYPVLSAAPHVVSPSGIFLSDTSSWIQIIGVFQAKGGEQWISIGNFDSIINGQSIFNTGSATGGVKLALCYIDDVSVNKIADGTAPGNPSTGAKNIIVCSDSAFPKTIYAPNGADGYEWSTGENSRGIIVDQEGDYWYKAIYKDCGIINDTVRIKHYIPKKLSLTGDTTLCSGPAVKLFTNDSFGTYQWNTGASTPEIEVTASGNYILTVTDECSTQTDSTSVTFSPRPDAPLINDTTVCRYDSLGALGLEGESLKWYKSGDTLGSTTIPVDTENEGVHELFVSRFNSYGCESEKTKFILSVIAPPSPIAFPDSIMLCPDENIVIGLETEHAEYEYRWNTGERRPSIQPSADGLYILTVENKCGIQKDSTYLAFLPRPDAPLIKDTTVCLHDSLGTLGWEGDSLKWYKSIEDTPGSTTLQISTDHEGTYEVFVSRINSSGCESERVKFTLNVIAPPLAISLPGIFTICPDDTALLGPETIHAGYAYSWNTGELTPFLRPSADGLYILEVENKCGLASDSSFVRFSDCIDCIWLPNAFSPNNDGHNDAFGVETKCFIQNYSLRIFNRWGQNVFESFNPEQKWDGGNHKTGTYFYRLEYQNSQGNRIKKRGDLTLIR